MKIGGFQKVSFINYPQKVSAVIFTQGCNFRCSYCHNPELVLPDFFGELVDINYVFDFLLKRRGQLDAVVVSGGEPTIHTDLIEFIKEIKKMKYFVKLDTNGSNPEMIKQILDLKILDFIAMDIKASLDDYSKVVGVNVDKEVILKSIYLIRKSQIEHMFRTTVYCDDKCINYFSEISQVLFGDKLIIQSFNKPRNGKKTVGELLNS